MMMKETRTDEERRESNKELFDCMEEKRQTDGTEKKVRVKVCAQTDTGEGQSEVKND